VRPLDRNYEVICNAIHSRRLLALTYGMHRRVVEPYIHGWTLDGVEVLLCYQREGESTSGFRTSWRTLHVDRIVEPELLDVVFAFDQADYDESAPEVRFVHCKVSP
jgi:hypothetical protein